MPNRRIETASAAIAEACQRCPAPVPKDPAYAQRFNCLADPACAFYHGGDVRPGDVFHLPQITDRTVSPGDTPFVGADAFVIGDLVSDGGGIRVRTHPPGAGLRKGQRGESLRSVLKGATRSRAAAVAAALADAAALAAKHRRIADSLDAAAESFGRAERGPG